VSQLPPHASTFGNARYARCVESSTPPVGMKRTSGYVADTARRNDTPPSVEIGKAFSVRRPSRRARSISGRCYDAWEERQPQLPAAINNLFVQPGRDCKRCSRVSRGVGLLGCEDGSGSDQQSIDSACATDRLGRAPGSEGDLEAWQTPSHQRMADVLGNPRIERGKRQDPQLRKSVHDGVVPSVVSDLGVDVS
jgi:hypothetical protein